MFLSIEEHDSDTLHILIQEKFKNEDGKEEVRTVSDLGYFPRDLELGSPEASDLIRKIIQEASGGESDLIDLTQLSPEGTADFFNALTPEDEERQIYNLGIPFIYHIVGLFDLEPVFKRLANRVKRSRGFYTFFRFLTALEIINPLELDDDYEFESIYTKFLDLSNTDPDDFFKFLEKNRLKIQSALFESIVRLTGKQDVTVFHCDLETITFYNLEIDPDYLDEFRDKVKESVEDYANDPLVALGIIGNDEVPLFFTFFTEGKRPAEIYSDMDELEELLTINLFFREVEENEEEEEHILSAATRGKNNRTAKMILNLLEDAPLSRSPKYVAAHFDLYVMSRAILHVILKAIREETDFTLQSEGFQKHLQEFEAAPIAPDVYEVLGLNRKMKSILDIFDLHILKKAVTDEEIKEIFGLK